MNEKELVNLIKSHREFFEGIVKHAPEGAPKEQVDIYRDMIKQIDEVLAK